MVWLKYYFKCDACSKVEVGDEVYIFGDEEIPRPVLPSGWKAHKVYRGRIIYEAVFYCPDHDVKIEVIDKINP